MAFYSQFMIIRGNVHASMRDRIYKVELKLDADAEIGKAAQESNTCAIKWLYWRYFPIKISQVQMLLVHGQIKNLLTAV
nr:unnamed protein product [Callosobruchus analis]